MLGDPIERMNDEELEQILDHALRGEEVRLLSKTLDELERRGHPIEV